MDITADLKYISFFSCINVCISKDNTSLFDIKSTLLPFKVCKILRMRKKLWLGAWSEMSSGISKKTYKKRIISQDFVIDIKRIDKKL